MMTFTVWWVKSGNIPIECPHDSNGSKQSYTQHRLSPLSTSFLHWTLLHLAHTIPNEKPFIPCIAVVLLTFKTVVNQV